MQKHGPAFLRLVEDAKRGVSECSAEDVKRRLDAGEKLVLVDVREESEFAADHIAGAMHLSKGIIERDIEVRVPEHDQEIILYCGGGFRSALAASNLGKMGYTNVISMDGGMRAWREANYPVEK